MCLLASIFGGVHVQVFQLIFLTFIFKNNFRLTKNIEKNSEFVYILHSNIDILDNHTIIITELWYNTIS